MHGKTLAVHTWLHNIWLMTCKPSNAVAGWDYENKWENYSSTTQCANSTSFKDSITSNNTCPKYWFHAPDIIIWCQTTTERQSNVYIRERNLENFLATRNKSATSTEITWNWIHHKDDKPAEAQPSSFLCCYPGTKVLNANRKLQARIRKPNLPEITGSTKIAVLAVGPADRRMKWCNRD